ncbi:MAG TPA: hotdog domain-containing protein [Thermoanaerobaculia bacterium]|nr:hotdog domain-containing protein [Thermoanaerobaculia bacterium]
MSRAELSPGAAGRVSIVVGEGDLASVLAGVTGDSFPRVLATARMIALMEIAAARALVPLLGEGELSVGVNLDVSHTAATPPGATVTATGTFLRMEGKLYVFEVVAEDGGGEIGRGLHRRAIVARERLEAGAARRVPPRG